MADTKITELTEVTSPADGDVLPIVDVSDTSQAASGSTRKVTRGNLLGGRSRVVSAGGGSFTAEQFSSTPETLLSYDFASGEFGENDWIEIRLKFFTTSDDLTDVYLRDGADNDLEQIMSSSEPGYRHILLHRDPQNSNAAGMVETLGDIATIRQHATFTNTAIEAGFPTGAWTAKLVEEMTSSQAGGETVYWWGQMIHHKGGA